MSNIVIQFASEMYNCATQNRKSFLPLRASGSDTCFVFSICRCLIKIMRFMLRRQHPELLMKLLRKIYIGCWSLITTLSLILDRFTKLKVLVFETATKMDAVFCVCLAIFNSPRTNNYYSSLLNVLNGMRISISATL